MQGNNQCPRENLPPSSWLRFSDVGLHLPTQPLSRMRVCLDGSPTIVLLFSDGSCDQCFNARATHATNRNIKCPSFQMDHVMYSYSSPFRAFETRGSFYPRGGIGNFFFRILSISTPTKACESLEIVERASTVFCFRLLSLRVCVICYRTRITDRFNRARYPEVVARYSESLVRARNSDAKIFRSL